MTSLAATASTCFYSLWFGMWTRVGPSSHVFGGGGIFQPIEKQREYTMCSWYSQPYLIGGSSYTSSRFQYCSNLFTDMLIKRQSPRRRDLGRWSTATVRRRARDRVTCWVAWRQTRWWSARAVRWPAGPAASSPRRSTWRDERRSASASWRAAAAAVSNATGRYYYYYYTYMY